MNQPCFKFKFSIAAVLLPLLFSLQLFSSHSAVLAQRAVVPVAPQDAPAVKVPAPEPKPFMGIVMTDAGGPGGVRITSVVAKTPAELAGLEVKDIIIEMGSVPVDDVDEIRAQIKKYSIGEPVVITVLRDDEEVKIELEFGNSVTQLPAVKPKLVSRTFGSADGLQVTADLYFLEDSDSETPLVILCHQAGWSRGEYREIAPKLNKLGFNCMAIDQRSGGTVNRVSNLTHMKAVAQSKTANFVTAEQDIVAAVNWAKSKHATGKVLLWGSSYSAALVIRIAGESPDLVDGVLAFAPGEYFSKFDKPKDWIASSAKTITVPVFITSAKDEAKSWASIYEAIPGDSKKKFLPETAGSHGSRALWKKSPDSADYWVRVEEFLEQFKVKLK